MNKYKMEKNSLLISTLIKQKNILFNDNEILQKLYNKIYYSSSYKIAKEISNIYKKEEFITITFKKENLIYEKWFERHIKRTNDFINLYVLYQNYIEHNNEKITYDNWVEKFIKYLIFVNIESLGNNLYVNYCLK